MSKKIFLIFLHAGRGNGKGERSGMIHKRYKYLSFLNLAIVGFLGLVVIMLAFGSEGCWFDPCLGQ